jgi:outer membrane protein OmpA-like peptidoglycan-associated protein
MKKQHNNDQWISISDMMTGLMIIFMFIALNYILQFMEFKFIEKDIYNALEIEFHQEIASGKIRLSPDGCISFSQDESTCLFESGETTLDSNFTSLLDSFIPKYLEILTNKDYINNIKEIRIEGHTDTVPLGPNLRRPNYDNYENNLWLSTERAISVLCRIRSSAYYAKLNDTTRCRLDFLFTANGLSYSRTKDNNQDYSYITGEEINNEISRRVEFRVITSNEKLAKKIFSR